MDKLPVASYGLLLPNGLMNAEDLSRELTERGVIISAQRLTELADAHYIPHYRVDDGPPVFSMTEARKWIGANLGKMIHGQSIPIEYRIISHPIGTGPCECPSPLSLLADRLIAQAPIVNVSGVYFLCRLGTVVYVGQSICTGSRIATHVQDGKEFDRAFILPVPPSQLDAVEGAFIRLLKPVENKITPAQGRPDSEVLAGVFGGANAEAAHA